MLYIRSSGNHTKCHSTVSNTLICKFNNFQLQSYKKNIMIWNKRRDSIAAGVTSWVARQQGAVVWFLAGEKFFSSPKTPNQLWSHQVFYSMDTVGLFTQGQSIWVRNEHSTPLVPRSECSNTSTPTYAFLACKRTTLPWLLNAITRLLWNISNAPSCLGSINLTTWHQKFVLLCKFLS